MRVCLQNQSIFHNSCRIIFGEGSLKKILAGNKIICYSRILFFIRNDLEKWPSSQQICSEIRIVFAQEMTDTEAT